MTMQRSLLERIRSPDPLGERRYKIATREVFDSILRNLQSILNTCQGNCLIDDRYGLPHLSSVRSAMPHSVSSYEASIRYTIERHEPRLKGVRVRHSPSRDHAMELRFEISGLIVDEDERTSVRFETVADEDGRLHVR